MMIHPTLIPGKSMIRNYPYVDSIYNNNLYNGINHSLRRREKNNLMADDIFYSYDKLRKRLSFFSSLDNVRKMALVDLCLTLGFNNFMELSEMFAAIQAKKWSITAKEILKIKHSPSLTDLYNKISSIMETGKL